MPGWRGGRCRRAFKYGLAKVAVVKSPQQSLRFGAPTSQLPTRSAVHAVPVWLASDESLPEETGLQPRYAAISWSRKPNSFWFIS